MLGIGFTELLVIGVVVLLFIKPDDLPRVMRELGRRYAQVRRASDELRRAFVMEADRQDAQERYRQLQERRRRAAAAREQAQEASGGVAQEVKLPGLADEPSPEGDVPDDYPRDIDIPAIDDPETPAPRAAQGGEER